MNYRRWLSITFSTMVLFSLLAGTTSRGIVSAEGGVKTDAVVLVKPSSEDADLLYSIQPYYTSAVGVKPAPDAPDCVTPSNAIEAENCLAGNPPSEWDVSGAGDLSIQGFATDISVNRGSTIQFKIDTTATAYEIRIYRLGYYNGNGARLVATIPSGAVTATNQLACSLSPIEMGGGATTSGQLLDCGNWSVSASWQVPADAVSGVYIARPTRSDNGGASHIPFIVRDDASHSDLLFQTSDTTWQAYNPYGGYNAYGSSGATMAEKLSYNRPFTLRSAELENYLFNAEYPMIRWLERNGYDVSYTSAIDIERYANLIQNHKVYMSVGHDEYWSQGRRDAVLAARDAGVHLAFFSANEIYWKIRWEDSTQGETGTNAYRTRVNYKEGSSAPSGSSEHRNCYDNYNCDPSPIWTGQWREAPGSTPENTLSGQISWRLTNPGASITVPAEYAPLRFWRNTAVAVLAPGGQATLGSHILGYEWDPEYAQYADWYPAGRVLLSSTDQSSFAGIDTHHLSLYRAASGALVFGAGTVQWSWGLDANHDYGTSTEDVNVQQATVNLLADMGVQPGSLQTGLVAATASTDTTPPTVTVTSPASGASVPGGIITITGTASDVGGAVGVVEISTNGGTTWRRATGRANWSYSYTGSTGAADIRVRAADDSVNLSAPITHTFNVQARVCPCSIWAPDSLGGPEDSDSNYNELGVKFRTDQAGWVTGIRFYKTVNNTGTHIGNLWDASGNNLASVIFSGETATGWQEAIFDTPVPVTAETTYIASYFGHGHYAQTEYYFTSSGLDDSPLHALKSEVVGGNGNGVYVTASTSTFPNLTWHDSNYWVDLVFVTEIGSDTTPPHVSSTTPANAAVNVPVTSAVTVTFNEAINSTTITGSTFELRDAALNLIPATITYSAPTRKATLTPNAALSFSTVYTATVKGGTGGVADLASNRLAADFAWSFTTSAPPPLPPNEGPGGPILVIADATNLSNPFGRYYAEILRAEGFNAYYVMDIANVTAATLTAYDVVLLGEMPLNSTQISMFDTWVSGGGNLIAFRPAKALATMYGLVDASSTTTEGYMAVNTGTTIGQGVAGDTLQFHGSADNYTLSGASSLATLYSNATTATAYPAAARFSRGSGQVVIFTFDLARSVILMRQGNPAWAGQEGDDVTGIRASDMFVGRSGQPNWIDANKLLIPQADEQMHLLSHAIEQLNANRLPLPRLWYFPGLAKGALIMTGDSEGCDYNCMNAPIAHANANGGTYTVYMLGTQATKAQVDAWLALGNGVAPHYDDTSEASNPTVANMSAVYDTMTQNQINAYAVAPRTVRNHWIVWTGWSEQAEIEAAHGIGLDTNYYHWGPWIPNPGYFTGSGLPLRFSDENGVILDIFQATTQLPDEKWYQNIDSVFKTMIDRSIDQGYYGFLTANFHPPNYGSFQTVAGNMMTYANSRGVPIWSAEKLLDFLQARSQARMENLAWNGTNLTFNFTNPTAYSGLTLMVPARAGGNDLLSVTSGGNPVVYTLQTIKGYDYALFSGNSGAYTATYAPDTTAPAITSHTPLANATNVAVNSNATVTFSEEMNVSTINGTTVRLRKDGAGSDVAAAVTYDALALTATLNPTLNLEYETLYHVTVAGTVADLANIAMGADQTWSFTTQSEPPPMVMDTTASDFGAGTGTCVVDSAIGGGAVRLGAAIDETFSGTWPAGWSNTPWTNGIPATIAGGLLTVNGALARNDTFYTSGRTLEFSATFTADAYQVVGFGANAATYDKGPWIMFSTGETGNQLYARITTSADGPYNSGDDAIGLGAQYLGASHLYWIVWNAGTIEFYIDGAQVAARSLAIATEMRVGISDYNNNGNTLTVDWIRMSPPYSTPCTFTSRVLDAGQSVNWGSLSWSSTIPTNTGLSMSYRTGSTPTPDGSWSGFIAASASPTSLGINSRYIQYQASLSTSDLGQTPVLNDVTITYATGADTTPPSITGRSPAPNATGVSQGSNVTVTFSEPMDAATLSSSSFRLRRAGDSSDVPATVTLVGNVATLDPATNLSLITTYQVTVAASAADLAGNLLGADDTWTFTTAADNCPCSIWNNTATPVSAPVNDHQPIEVGTKFRSSTAGYITALRYYKGAGDTDTHVGHLWASTGGSPLATVTFSGETASGWQVMALPTPVLISANTTYITSIYSSPTGNFAYTAGGLATTFDNPPLRALASGEDGPNGVYQYGGGFPSNGASANYWVDVVFETTLAGDTTPPVISVVSATPAAGGLTATITWTTNEPATSRVDYGISPDALTQIATTNGLVTSHSVQLTGLSPSTIYYYRVTSVDASVNSATSPAAPAPAASFTTLAASFTDTTPDDFNAGSIGACVVDASLGNGALRLSAPIYEDFLGSSLPSGWINYNWSGSSPTVSGGLLTVNGSEAYTSTQYGSGRTLEFNATFAAQPYQHIGFSGILGQHNGNYVPFVIPPWIMFSTGNDGLHLYARVLPAGSTAYNTGNDKILIGDYLGVSHKYRIDWKTDSIDFYVDGYLKTTVTATIASSMNISVSDYQSEMPSLTVDWLHLTPYASPCSFVSRVFDSGAPANWNTLSWNGNTPSGTSLGLSYRIGSTPTPDSTWTTFTSVTSSPAALAGNSRYIQYSAALATSNPAQTPVLSDVTITYTVSNDATAPTVIARSPEPNAMGVNLSTNVSATFSELMAPGTITSSSFRLRRVGDSSDVPAVVTLVNNIATLNPAADLEGLTTYQVIVAGSVTDQAGNPLGTETTWVFTTADVLINLVDTTTANFNAGTAGACVVDAAIGDGAVRLPKTIEEDFLGTTLPTGWSSGIWNTGSTVSVLGGNLTVDGARAYTTATFAPYRSLEFRATFTAAQYQNIGFAFDGGFNNPWIVIGEGSSTDGVYARTNSGTSTLLSTTTLGNPHIYRINWTSSGFDFYIDGSKITTITSQLVSSNMLIMISDLNAGGGNLTVDWVRVTPYVSPCTFTSRIFDAGFAADWQSLAWSGLSPSGAGLSFETRTGNAATVDGSWSGWQSAGPLIGSPDGRYIQYRVALSTTDVNHTPVVENVTLQYSVTQRANLTLQAGWNLITLPIQPVLPLNAETLLTVINAQGQSGNCSDIYRWEDGGWDTYVLGIPIPPFDITAGRGYFVYCGQASTYALRGIPFSSGVSLSLVPGYNLVGFPYPQSGRTAESVLTGIGAQGGACSEVHRWVSGGWDSHFGVIPAVNNFSISVSEGYFVYCAAPSSYTP